MRAEDEPETAASLRMKPRETVQLAAVHVRIPEQLARGLRLMSVLEGRQAQVIVAEMLEEHLTRWNPRWRETVPARET
jgi:TorA maturation chaperone TorD